MHTYRNQTYININILYLKRYVSDIFRPVSSVRVCRPCTLHLVGCLLVCMSASSFQCTSVCYVSNKISKIIVIKQQVGNNRCVKAYWWGWGGEDGRLAPRLALGLDTQVFLLVTIRPQTLVNVTQQLRMVHVRIYKYTNLHRNVENVLDAWNFKSPHA